MKVINRKTGRYIDIREEHMNILRALYPCKSLCITDIMQASGVERTNYHYGMTLSRLKSLQALNWLQIGTEVLKPGQKGQPKKFYSLTRLGKTVVDSRITKVDSEMLDSVSSTRNQETT